MLIKLFLGNVETKGRK